MQGNAHADTRRYAKEQEAQENLDVLLKASRDSDWFGQVQVTVDIKAGVISLITNRISQTHR